MLNKDNKMQILNQTDEEGMVDMAAEVLAGLFLRQWDHNKRKEDARSLNPNDLPPINVTVLE